MKKRVFKAHILLSLLSTYAATLFTCSAFSYDGQILNQFEFSPPAFSDQVGFANPEAYDMFVNWYKNEFSTHYQFIKIKYESDHLKVTGFVAKPRHIYENQKFPVIIYNHGGNGEGSKFAIDDLQDTLPLLSNGFIIIGSQYRGLDGGEGKDEFGGADVHDVINLSSVIKQLPYADSNNIFLLGFSRGTMMAMISNKNGLKVNAIASVSGALDLTHSLEERPAMESVYKYYIPYYETNKEHSLIERSALSWPEKISAPLLILQSEDDSAVSAREAKLMGSALESLNKPYRLVVFEKGNHGLRVPDDIRHTRDSEIISWFKRYLK